MNNEEIWKEIDDYEGLYIVSNYGRVKSTYRKKCLLKSELNSNGYYRVQLHKDKKRKKIFVHRLVAKTFVPNPDGKPCIDHINGIRTDNRAENLRWCTQKENLSYGLSKEHMRESKIKLYKDKKNHPRSIPVIQLTKDFEFIKEYNSASKASFDTGVSPTSIWDCCSGGREIGCGYRWMYKKDWEALTSQ